MNETRYIVFIYIYIVCDESRRFLGWLGGLDAVVLIITIIINDFVGALVPLYDAPFMIYCERWDFVEVLYRYSYIVPVPPSDKQYHYDFRVFDGSFVRLDGKSHTQQAKTNIRWPMQGIN